MDHPFLPCVQMAEHKHSQQMPDSGRGGEGAEVGREDPRVSSVLERLSELEGRVGGQLDQLVHLQQQQVFTLKICNIKRCATAAGTYAVTFGRCVTAAAIYSVKFVRHIQVQGHSSLGHLRCSAHMYQTAASESRWVICNSSRYLMMTQLIVLYHAHI